MRTFARTLWQLSFFAGTSLIASPSFAALCPGGLVAVSCHQLMPTAEQGEDGTPLAIAGYPPLGVEAGKLLKPAGTVKDGASSPSLRLETSGGAWGSEGREPIVIASVSYEYGLGAGAAYLSNPSSGRYSFTCDPSSEPLCHPDGSLASRGQGFLQRRYRVTVAPGATLPSGVVTAPIRVDYAVDFRFAGVREESGVTKQAVRAEASVGFGPFIPAGGTSVLFGGDSVDCRNDLSTGALLCDLTQYQKGSTPTTATGTLAREVPIDGAQPLYLRLMARVQPHDSGVTCEPRNELPNSPCLVDAWSGSGRIVSDPYVYVDPAWPHAALVRVEMAEDETETTWVTPKRTTFDLETLTVTEGEAPPDAGTPGDDGGTVLVDGGTGGPDSGGDGNGDDDAPPSGGTKKDEGGCAVATGALPASLVGVWLTLAGVAVSRRRRARRTGATSTTGSSRR